MSFSSAATRACVAGSFANRSTPRARRLRIGKIPRPPSIAPACVVARMSCLILLTSAAFIPAFSPSVNHPPPTASGAAASSSAFAVASAFPNRASAPEVAASAASRASAIDIDVPGSFTVLCTISVAKSATPESGVPLVSACAKFGPPTVRFTPDKASDAAPFTSPSVTFCATWPSVFIGFSTTPATFRPMSPTTGILPIVASYAFVKNPVTSSHQPCPSIRRYRRLRLSVQWSAAADTARSCFLAALLDRGADEKVRPVTALRTTYPVPRGTISYGMLEDGGMV